MIQVVLEVAATFVMLNSLFSPLPGDNLETATKPKQDVLAAQVSIPSVPLKPTSYEVVSGDSLASISKKVYGNEALWVILWNDNPSLSDPTVLFSGMNLTLRGSTPALEEPNRALPSPTLTATPTQMPIPTLSQQSLGGPVSFDEVYKAAGDKFGVPWQVLYALHMLESGQRDGPVNSGYAYQGPMQFLPSTFAAYAVDGNGDGVTDINNAVDAIHTAANFIAKHGSVENGLRAYGNNFEAVKRIASTLGWTP